MRALRAMALLVGVAVVALLPLYGDVRPPSAVSHAEWARMVLRGMGLLADAPGVNDTAAQAFATLSGRDSRAFAADQYVRAQHVQAFAKDGVRGIRASGGIGEAVYALGVARQGDYRFRFDVSGPAAAEAEVTKAGSDDVLRSFKVPAGPAMGWIDAGSLHLDPGAYNAAVLLPEGGSLAVLGRNGVGRNPQHLGSGLGKGGASERPPVEIVHAAFEGFLDCGLRHAVRRR